MTTLNRIVIYVDDETLERIEQHTNGEAGRAGNRSAFVVDAIQRRLRTLTRAGSGSGRARRASQDRRKPST